MRQRKPISSTRTFVREAFEQPSFWQALLLVSRQASLVRASPFVLY